MKHTPSITARAHDPAPRPVWRHVGCARVLLLAALCSAARSSPPRKPSPAPKPSRVGSRRCPQGKASATPDAHKTHTQELRHTHTNPTSAHVQRPAFAHTHRQHPAQAHKRAGLLWRGAP